MNRFPTLSKRLASWSAVLFLASSSLVLAQDTRTHTDAPPAVPALGESALHNAARLGNRDEVEQLLKADPASRDARTELGITPLHYAAMNKDSGPLKALLKAGAKPNARDSEGRTPLHMAAFSQRTDNAMLLLDAGADPTIQTHAGRDVLSMARKVRADELAGKVSLWILKGCKPGKPC